TVLQLARVALQRAAEARQVARVERLEHENEGVTLPPGDGIAHLVADRVRHDVDREPHPRLFLFRDVPNPGYDVVRPPRPRRRRCARPRELPPRCRARAPTAGSTWHTDGT